MTLSFWVQLGLGLATTPLGYWLSRKLTEPWIAPKAIVSKQLRRKESKVPNRCTCYGCRAAWAKANQRAAQRLRSNSDVVRSLTTAAEAMTEKVTQHRLDLVHPSPVVRTWL